ncbi:MAG: hypothetical protein ACK5CA_05335, partial [Cyanobacteriota bacterium]
MYLHCRAPPVSLDADLLINLSAAYFVSPPPSAACEFDRRAVNQSPAPPVLYLHRRAPPVSLTVGLLINPQRRLFCISTAER